MASWFAKIDRAVHADEKFRSLSRPQPNAQTLWFHFLAGPHLSPIPGLITQGEASFAEELEWPLGEHVPSEGFPEGLPKGFPRGFREAYWELSSKGMAKADWRSRLVWLPNALKRNKPDNPNVVTGWMKHLELIPECYLKVESISALASFMAELGEGFLRAFREGMPNGYGNGSVNRSTNGMANKEKEKEKDKLKEKDNSSSGKPGGNGLDPEKLPMGPSKKNRIRPMAVNPMEGCMNADAPQSPASHAEGRVFPDGVYQRAVDGWATAYKHVHNVAPVMGGRDWKALSDILSACGANVEEFASIVKAWLREPEVGRAKGHPIYILLEDLNHIRSKIANGKVGQNGSAKPATREIAENLTL